LICQEKKKKKDELYSRFGIFDSEAIDAGAPVDFKTWWGQA
jgi:hypothetical protein